MSAWNSQTVVNQPTGSGWKTSTFCNSTTACVAGGSAHVTSAAKLGGDIGITSRHKASSSSTFYYYFYASGSYNSYLQITFSGVSDTKASGYGKSVLILESQLTKKVLELYSLI